MGAGRVPAGRTLGSPRVFSVRPPLDLRLSAAGQNGLSAACFCHSSCSLLLSLRQHSVLGAKSHRGQHVGSGKKYRKPCVQPGWPWEGPCVCLLGGHGLGGFSSRHWFSYGSGGQKPEISVPADLVSFVAIFRGLWLAISLMGPLAVLFLHACMSPCAQAPLRRTPVRRDESPS